MAGGGSGGLEATSGAAGEAPELCKTAIDCSNGDDTDGEERCVAGACQAGDPPPQVISITPADGADEVELDATVEVTFSEPLDSSTVTSETVKLFAGEREVPGVAKLSSTRKTVSFEPEQPMDLWTAYRVELSHEISSVSGPAMLDDFSASFVARDGVWSIQTLAEEEAIEPPSSLPVTSDGALLTSWLFTQAPQCAARGGWVLRGETKADDGFASELSWECSHISASMAPDGSAAVGWGEDFVGTTQSFVNGSWDQAARRAISYAGVGANLQVLAQDARHISLVSDYSDKRMILQGPARGEWNLASDYSVSQETPSPVAVVYGTEGVEQAVWTYSDGVYALGYDPNADEWGADATALPGTAAAGVTRGVPRIAASPDGDTLVLWMEGPPNSRALKSSRLVPGTGWAKTPTTVSSGVGDTALFDAPALVFDGVTFVSAWTAVTSGKLTAYTSRYDMKSGKWGERKAHVSDRGESAVLMPRLGVDSNRNLMLVWAVGVAPMSLAYQRYRAETDEWGSVERLSDESFVDAAFTTEGKLPFAMAPNGLAGVLFRIDESDGTQKLKLASFF